MDTNTNAFVNVAFDKAKATVTENGAKTYVTTGSELVDQFGKAGSFRGRNILDVFEDQAKLWNENMEAALRFVFYLRMITRKVKINPQNETEKVQKGQGARDESFKRLLWIAKEHPTEFYNNIWALPLVGSWKDVWTLMYYDIHEGINTINRNAMFELIGQGLLCKTHIDLVKKFMPRIKSESKCTTDWTKITNALAKEFADFMKITYKEYNKTKSSGNAHTFQKLICSRNYNALNWNHIPGRALTLLVSSKFLKNHNLKDSYTQWIMQQPVAKFTGYVFELVKKLREKCGGYRLNTKISPELKHTFDAQFKGLVDKARADGNVTENVWCCLDTSGSMCRRVDGLKGVTCEDIALSLAMFFSDLNTGEFHNKLIMFDNVSKEYDMVGESFCERISKLPAVSCGGTNFQSAVDVIINIRKKNPEIPLEAYPTTILVVSDMEFNPATYSWRGFSFEKDENETNYEYSKNSLKTVFPSDFVDNMKFIWWDVASRHGNNHYEGSSIEPGCSFFSGWDGSIVSMILGEDAKVVNKATGESRQMTAEEIVEKALNQEILSYIKAEEQ